MHSRCCTHPCLRETLSALTFATHAPHSLYHHDLTTVSDARPNIKYFAAHGVRGIFEEGSYDTSGGDMDALKDYVIGRMLWDVTLDPDTLIAEFVEGYFGTAASPFVWLYLDTVHGAVAETGQAALFCLRSVWMEASSL